MEKIYEVNVKEVWCRTFRVIAENEEQAKEKANTLIEEGQEEEQLGYSHTLDMDDWGTYDLTGEGYSIPAAKFIKE
jgi:cytidylate kinase